MKWFRHMTIAHSNEKISRLLESSGLAGFGAYWYTLEIVAGDMGKADLKCSAEHSLARWGKLMDIHPNQAKKYLKCMQSAGLIDLEIIEGRYRVIVPNLLKYRDEYSKKSGHAPESIPTDSSSEQSRPNQLISNQNRPPQRKCEFSNEPCEDYAVTRSRYCERHNEFFKQARERRKDNGRVPSQSVSAQPSLTPGHQHNQEVPRVH